ncbi:MAG TPA: glycosyltransferase family 39 protein [Terriglobia bacterium]|nr:glycosyltransferase family 39 protein [Terriglobia bacterium]
MIIRRLSFTLILLAFLTRVFVAVYPGRQLATPWSGGNDTPAYVALAHSLVAGQGLSYYGMPSAIRPPIYPMFLAVNLLLFGNSFPVVVRLLQFGAGILTAVVCWLIARKLWGEERALVGFAAAMALPTQIFFTGELLTECFAAFISSVFLLLIADTAIAERRNAILAGVLIGIGTLLRFNLIVLGIVFFFVLLSRVGFKRSVAPTALAAVTSLLILTPWLIRNRIAFHGSVFLSSQTGVNLAQGVLTPDGRAQRGEIETLKKTMGWVHEQIEVNSPDRLKLPDEGTLNRQTMQLIPGIWRQEGPGAPFLMLRKLGYFWLSTDQAFDTRLFSPKVRIIRACGVLFYWSVLSFAIFGWFKLKVSQPSMAAAFLIFAATVTVFHLPFVMNTRIATPFIAPLVCILCPGTLSEGHS